MNVCLSSVIPKINFYLHLKNLNPLKSTFMWVLYFTGCSPGTKCLSQLAQVERVEVQPGPQQSLQCTLGNQADTTCMFFSGFF